MAEKKPELSRFFCWVIGTETSAVVFTTSPVEAIRVFRLYLADGHVAAFRGVLRVVAFKDTSRRAWRVGEVWDVPQWCETLAPVKPADKGYLAFVVANRWNGGDLVGVSL